MEEEAKKKFLMKVGVISLMALIVIFWILNVKNVFRGNEEADNGQNAAEWKNLKNDLSATVDQLSVSLDKIEAADAEMKAASSSLAAELAVGIIADAASSSPLGASSSVAAIFPAAASSSPSAASSSPETKADDCPHFIDCMPSIGEARPCQIPAGCEGITQIAY